MKKLLIIIFIFLAQSINNLEVSATCVNGLNSEYFNYDLTSKELENYYINNKIFISSSNSTFSERRFYEEDVDNHLATRFNDYSNWKKTSETKYVKDVYGENPEEIYEYDNYIQVSKRQAGNNNLHIGCGPLAMICQFEYLAKTVGYSPISSSIENSREYSTAKERTRLAKEIISNTDTIPAESSLGQSFGVAPNAGSFTFPSEFINSSRELLTRYNLAVPKTKVTLKNGKEVNETYYDDESLVIVEGDTLPNYSSLDKKIEKLKKSIDNGMPVVWWTINNKAEGYSGHYMNIFGYEYWQGTDSNGNVKRHLMFILRYNWGEADVYLDSDVLEGPNGGFIFFCETHNRCTIKPSDYGYECEYKFDSDSKTIVPMIGSSFTTNYLRTGYVNRYLKNKEEPLKELTMSAKRNGAGTAYIEYSFDNPIDWVYLEMSWWSFSEGISGDNGNAIIQYKDKNNNWITQLNLFNDLKYPLSILIDSKTKIKCKFDKKPFSFRIIVNTNNPSGDRNKGRLVLGDIMVVFPTSYSEIIPILH